MLPAKGSAAQDWIAAQSLALRQSAIDSEWTNRLIYGDNLVAMAALLAGGESTYPLSDKVCAASVHLKTAFSASGRTYRSRSLCAALQSQDLSSGRHRVRSLMRINQLRSIQRPKFTHTLESKPTLPESFSV